jgi:hypothetical protein
MAKEPRDRFESCGALSSALQDRLDASPSLAPERIRPPRTPTRRALPTGRLRIMVVVAAALVVAAVTGAVLLSGGSSAPACPRFARSRKTLEQIVPKFVAPGTFRTAPPRADDLAVDQHGIWVVTPSGADLMCARPGQVGGSLALPFRPTALAMGDNGVWVAGTARGSRASGSNPGRVTRIVSPAIAPGPSRDLQDPPRAVAVGVGSKAIWILSTRGTLLRLSRPDVGPEGGTPIQVRSVRVGAGASDVVVGDTDVWVSNERSSTVISVDPTTLRRIGRPISLPGGAALAATPGTIWSLDREAQALTPIDTRTRRPGRSIPVGRLPLDVEAANGYVWVANGWSVWRVDPRTHDIRKAPVAGRVIAFTVQPPSLTRGQAIWALVRKPHER